MVDLSPATVVPLRQYKAHYKTEDDIKREMHKVGQQIIAGSREIEGTKFAQLTVLAADYVELKMRETNDRDSIKERDIRNFIKASIGYGDAQGRVAAQERSSTIEALLGVSAMAAFLYHHSFNGCDIRYFVGTEPAEKGKRGAVPRLAMPFNKWLPRIQILGSETKRIDNPDGSYRPLPTWAIRAQYQLMVTPKAEIDKDTGRIARGPVERPSTFDKLTATVDTAIKSGNVTAEQMLTAVSLVVTVLRSDSKAAVDEKVEDALVWLYELLDRRYGDEEKTSGKRNRKASS
jgi:hypothetical protein